MLFLMRVSMWLSMIPTQPTYPIDMESFDSPWSYNANDHDIMLFLDKNIRYFASRGPGAKESIYNVKNNINISYQVISSSSSFVYKAMMIT